MIFGLRKTQQTGANRIPVNTSGNDSFKEPTSISGNEIVPDHGQRGRRSHRGNRQMSAFMEHMIARCEENEDVYTLSFKQESRSVQKEPTEDNQSLSEIAPVSSFVDASFIAELDQTTSINSTSSSTLMEWSRADLIELSQEAQQLILKLIRSDELCEAILDFLLAPN